MHATRPIFDRRTADNTTKREVPHLGQKGDWTVGKVSWPSGLRRSTQVRVYIVGVGSNPTGTTFASPGHVTGN